RHSCGASIESREDKSIGVVINVL
ncbi:MAG: hypothetical protein JWP13_826, partial [Candidatus Saccharibacteria bacterium]|nr:hypothetical protein [Candidatus Saccharibacteria bacterium]